MLPLMNTSASSPPHSTHSTAQSLHSSQCSASQRTEAEQSIVFSDGNQHFRDSWTCHTQPCTIRQRIIHCDSQQAHCINNWSCQQCIYGGSHLQCRICASNCAQSQCFSSSQCYAYLCSDSLRAYQCYFQSSKCHNQSQQTQTLSDITNNCKQCALNDQDVAACYICYTACFQHSCWNNCSINAYFDLHSVRFTPINTTNTTHTGSTALNPILLTANAIGGIMAMVGLICLIFGFWCGRNCSAHSLSKLCCKWCVLWCDDDKFSEFDDESAWNWKTQSVSKHSKHSVNMDMTPDEKGALNGHKAANVNYRSTAQAQKKISKNLRMRFPMTPLTSRDLPRQQNVEQSPDVRVAHFSTPIVDAQIDIDDGHVPLHLMKSIESDEDDAPAMATGYTHRLTEILLKREDSFDGFALQNHKEDSTENESKETEKSLSTKRYAKDDMTMDDNRDKLCTLMSIKSPLNTKRVTSADSHLGANQRMNRQIIVLKNNRSDRGVVSPPPITSRSQFQSLLRPTMSADAIALKKLNKK